MANTLTKPDNTREMSIRYLTILSDKMTLLVIAFVMITRISRGHINETG